MAYEDIRKNFSMRVDGRGYVGQVDEFNPPKLAKKTDEYRAGGMNAPVKIGLGMEAMDVDWSMKKFDVNLLGMFGLAEGNYKAVTLNEVLESHDGTTTAVVHTMRGTFIEIDPGSAKAADPGTTKFTMNLVYYKLQHGSTVVQEIDIINMIHMVNGVDQLAAQRTALAI